MSDGYVSIVSGRSLARPYNGIKRMRRRSENLVASSRASLLSHLFEDARRDRRARRNCRL